MAKTAMKFEEALSQLEGLVSALEKGDMPLEESLKAYEKGVALAAFCEKALSGARLKLSELQPQKPEEDNTDEQETLFAEDGV